MERTRRGSRTLSVCAFSFLFAYQLSFLFEGKVLYCLFEEAGADAAVSVLSAIVAHFFGQFTCGFFCRSPRCAKRTVLLCMGLCFLLTVVFFFAPSALWLAALIAGGYASGCAVAAWGYFLRAYTPKNERIKSCADMLIYSNLLMIAVNMVAANFSAKAGLALAMLCLLIAMAFTWRLPVDEVRLWAAEPAKPVSDLRKPMGVLFLFVAIITVNSGLMYQVINPAFEHLTFLTSWYWAVPYIAALFVMRNLPVKIKRPVFLYVGMGMIMCAFLAFMLLGRGAVDYLVVDTLMLGACGIFDLFWWSIIGETLEYAKNPVSVFGIGLSANVFGVLCGDVLGVGITAVKLPGAQVAVIALCVVCVTLIILPPLNRQLSLLLRTHAYLSAYSALTEQTQMQVAAAIAPLSPLTGREQEILQLVLAGKSNRDIAICGVPNIQDIPDDISVEYIETPRPHGPHGSSGVSECFQSSGHMAVINAINNACGVRIYDLPARPAKVKAAWDAKQAGAELKPAKYYLGKDFEDMLEEIRSEPIG